MLLNDHNKLDKIIQHISKKVPFYAIRFSSSTLDIAAFPIIKKEILKHHYADFISDDLCKDKPQLVKFLQEPFVPENYVIEKPFSKNIIIEWTSGSSGIPFKCLKTKQEPQDRIISLEPKTPSQCASQHKQAIGIDSYWGSQTAV